MKKTITLFLALCMLFAAFGCAKTNGSEEPVSGTFTFTDSVGRTVELPTNIERVAISGPLAQIVVFALCPE